MLATRRVVPSSEHVAKHTDYDQPNLVPYPLDISLILFAYASESTLSCLSRRSRSFLVTRTKVKAARP